MKILYYVTVAVLMYIASYYGSVYASDIRRHHLGDIEPSFEIRALVTNLNNASPDSNIIIDIDSYGGRVDTMNIIIRAILNTNGNVVCVLNSKAASAGAMILVQGCVNNPRAMTIVSDMAVILFHLPKICRSDDDCIPVIGEERTEAMQYMVAITKGILTKSELARMFRLNADIILTGEEFNKRIKKL